jgi:hypothetical protein
MRSLCLSSDGGGMVAARAAERSDPAPVLER